MSKKKTERTLIIPLLAMVLCCAMFVGTTYAWFTISVSNKNNRIMTGILDVGLYQVENTDGALIETPVTEETTFFVDAKWEPGSVCYENFRVKNEGSLPLKYELALKWSDYNFIKESSESQSGPSLTDVLRVAVVEGHIDTAEEKDAVLAKIEAAKQSGSAEKCSGTLVGMVNTGEAVNIATDQLTIVVYWPESENDSIYNVSSNTVLSEDTKLFAELGLVLTAIQTNGEADSFSAGFDDDAAFSGQEESKNEE